MTLTNEQQAVLTAMNNKADIDIQRGKNMLGVGVSIGGILLASVLTLQGVTYESPYHSADDVELDTARVTTIASECFSAQRPQTVPYSFDQSAFDDCAATAEQSARQAQFERSANRAGDALKTGAFIALLSLFMGYKTGMGLYRNRGKSAEAQRAVDAAVNALGNQPSPPAA